MEDTAIPIFDIRRSRPSTSPPRTPTQSPSTPRRGILVGERTYPHPTQTDEAHLIAQILGSPMGSVHAIPKNIHRFWTGGPMRDAVVKELIADGKRAKEKGWTCYLWYSAEIEAVLDEDLETRIRAARRISFFKKPPMPEDRRPKRKDQRRQLEMAGYRVIPIERLDTSEGWLAKLARRIGGSAVNGQWDDVKYFSDLARLMYLHFEGGIHMDVDIALGDLDLTQQYYHNDPSGNVPLMGSLLRDQKDQLIPKLRYLKRLRRQPTLTKEEQDGYMEALTALVNRGMNGSGMFNALIASRPQTTHLEDTIDEFRETIDQIGMVSGMSLARTLLLGKLNKRGNADQAMKWTVPPYLVRLDPDTEESNL